MIRRNQLLAVVMAGTVSTAWLAGVSLRHAAAQQPATSPKASTPSEPSPAKFRLSGRSDLYLLAWPSYTSAVRSTT